MPDICWFVELRTKNRVLCVCSLRTEDNPPRNRLRSLFGDDIEESGTWLVFLCNNNSGSRLENLRDLIESGTALSLIRDVTVVIVSDGEPSSQTETPLPQFSRKGGSNRRHADRGRKPGHDYPLGSVKFRLVALPVSAKSRTWDQAISLRLPLTDGTTIRQRLSSIAFRAHLGGAVVLYARPAGESGEKLRPQHS